MRSASPKYGLDVSITGHMPPINGNLPLASASEAHSDAKIQNASTKLAPKRDAKSTVARSIFNAENQDLSQKLPINYVFSKNTTRSSNYLQTSGAVGVGVGLKVTDPLLQPVVSTRNGLQKRGTLVTGTSVITFGSPLLSHGYADGIGISAPQLTTKSLASALRAFNPPQVHCSSEDDKNCRHLSIEGVRTGEESIIEISESHRKKKSTPQDSSSFDQEEQRRLLCKIRTECRYLTDQLQKKSFKIQKMRAMSALYIEESEKRSQLERDYWVERDELICFTLQKLHRTSHAAIAQLRADCMLQIVQLQKELQNARRELESYKSVKDEYKMQEIQVRAGQSAENEKLKQEIERLRSELEDQRTQFAHEKQRLSVEIAESQGAQQKLTEQLRGVKNELAEESFLIQQCRIFLKQICQPSFHVVKGASLEPVEPNRPEPSGFVLIPLVVLLHGYSLLPIREREDVIRQYEQKGSELTDC